MWGKRWEYLWLFTTCKIAPEYVGKRIVLRSEIAESTVFVNDSLVAVCNAHVDNGCHNKGDKQLENSLQQLEKRTENDLFFVGAKMT